ncbi:MAG TPA: hypothetical protein PLV45_01575 [bacterium]|nr:hypothetical protein [bacterium]
MLSVLPGPYGDSIRGIVLDYGTSLSEVTLEMDGIGRTAPNHFHHWVGYASSAYL